MPSSEFIEARPLKGGAVAVSGGSPHPSEPENLPCPRCESTNTKFCYYNNYNLSQPRYFCKGCRRYWTRGGSLRNIPVGGGSRKNSKRSRANSAAHSPMPLQQIAPLSSPVSDVVNTTSPQSSAPGTTPVSFVDGIKHETLSPLRCDMNLNEALPGSFSSLLCSQQGGGFPGLGGYGMGLGSGSGSSFDLLGFGFGKAEWPAMVDIGVGADNDGNGGVGVAGGSSGGSSSGCNTWQMEGMDGGGLTDGGDCFGWPELAISTPGTAGLE